MRKYLREIAITFSKLGLPSVKMMERFLSLLIMSRDFKQIFNTTKYTTRDLMWFDGIDQFSKNSILYIEFGVWEGDSMKRITNHITDKNSRFFGFDSFKGLPETWDTMTGVKSAGSFSTSGNLPILDDDRVTFVTGWFQNTVPKFISQLQFIDKESLVVHYDADIYSSTLFCLMQIDLLKVPYLAIFDEFPGHETRALYNYMQATGAKVKFIGRRVVANARYPQQVMAIISPVKYFDI